MLLTTNWYDLLRQLTTLKAFRDILFQFKIKWIINKQINKIKTRQKVINWAKDKGLLKPENTGKQALKMISEIVINID